MSTDLVIVGCGGLGREVVGIVDATNARSSTWNLLGFVDDAPDADNLRRADALELAVLGDVDALTQMLRDRDVWFAIAVGAPAVRRQLSSRIGQDDRAATLVDPRAAVGRDVRLGRGVVLSAGAHVTTNVELGDHVFVDRNAQVGHDCVLEDFATVHPSAVLSGQCHIEAGARIGTAATVLPGRRVGREAFVGAGACVVQDVAANSTVKGIPAR